MQDVLYIYLIIMMKYKKKKKNGNKKFSENVNEKEKDIINAIYISKILDDLNILDVKIHDYAVYLYGEYVVEKIEYGNNKNIVEVLKNIMMMILK